MSLGRIIAGKYQLLKQIDCNEKVAVFAGMRIGDEKDVVVKILRQQWVSDDDLLDQFTTEVKSVAALKHKNIAEIYDVDYVDGIYYVAMEHVKGDSLYDIVSRQVELPLVTVINIVSQAASVLKHAYEQGIKYRTLKLSNMYLQENGILKIINFNIPRSILSPSVGTITENVGIGPDIFFLGLLLYELITFRFPLDEKHRIVTDLKMLKMLNLEKDLVIENRNIPIEEKRELENIIFKATTKEIELRYHIIEDFQREMEKWVESHISAAPAEKSASTAADILDSMEEFGAVARESTWKPPEKKIFDDDDSDSDFLKKIGVMWIVIGTAVLLAVILYVIW